MPFFGPANRRNPKVWGLSRPAAPERRRGLHPYIPELCEQLRKEMIGRRDFLRTATLLGLSASAAYALAGFPGGDPVAGPALAQDKPRKGGRLRIAMRVQRMDDPATYDWTEMSNQTRHVLEYLTITGPDNVTRPFLAESWEASDDLKTWILKLRQDVTWSNGDRFGADDVVYNFERWLDPARKSSNLGLFPELTDLVDTGKVDENGKRVVVQRRREGAVEKVDEHTVRLHLKSPQLAVPENLYSYPTAIVHRGFDEQGGTFAKNPIGTGPFALVELMVGERCLLRRRGGAYWGGEINLEEILYIDHGDDAGARIEALAADEVDMVHEVDIAQTEAVEAIPDAVLQQAVTAQTGVARMRILDKPFRDKRVRQAIVASMDHKAILDAAYRGRGAIGENHHVAPVHPDYFELPKLKQDHERAKALLLDAGYESMALNLQLSQSEPWHLAAMQAFKEQLVPAGVKLDLNPMPGATYWDVWDKTPFGFTSWAHRPLGTMVLNLAYRTGVPWNETAYSNPEFDKALDAAGGILDVGERRKAMEAVESILQDDAVIAQPLWRAVFAATNKRVRGFEMHPTQFHQFNKVWLE